MKYFFKANENLLISKFYFKMVFTDDGIRIMNETDPSTFCTIEFFEHELQTTPIVKGKRPD